MKRYYYELMDEDYNSYEAAIPDGRIKARAIAQAKRAMRDLGIRRALLVVNSMRTPQHIGHNHSRIGLK